MKKSVSFSILWVTMKIISILNGAGFLNPSWASDLIRTYYKVNFAISTRKVFQCVIQVKIVDICIEINSIHVSELSKDKY